jgi:hypothetical protein
VLAFDKYIYKNKLVNSKPETTEDAINNSPTLDVDIAFGYETMKLESVKDDKNVQHVISQI